MRCVPVWTWCSLTTKWSACGICVTCTNPYWDELHADRKGTVSNHVACKKFDAYIFGHDVVRVRSQAIRVHFPQRASCSPERLLFNVAETLKKKFSTTNTKMYSRL